MKIEKTLALKARFTSGTPVGSAPIESRFQPRKLSGLPQALNNAAPLALNTHLQIVSKLSVRIQTDGT
jgi:hypothetical protein